MMCAMGTGLSGRLRRLPTGATSRRSCALAAAAAVAAFALAGAHPARAGDVAVTTEPYGAATVTSDASGTLIGAPGGLFYRSTLDPAKTYTVSIDGENVSGGFNLRVGKDGAFSWLAAPKGVKRSGVRRVGSVEGLSCRDWLASPTAKAST